MNEIDRPEEFELLADRDKRRLLTWIEACFEKARYATGSTSYGMKHWFEHDANVYVTNGQFKGAMLAAGWEPVDQAAQNWQFRCRWKGPCQAKTARGLPCRRRRLPGFKLCSIHHYR